MFVARELGKSLDEVLDMTTLELRMWAAFYSLENKNSKKTQKKHGRY